MLLDFVEVPDAHTGQRLGQEVEGILKAFGVEDKVIHEENPDIMVETYFSVR